MKYIVTSSGLEAREVNPDGSRMRVASARTYPLTQPMSPGSEIECKDEPVWQFRHTPETRWLKSTVQDEVETFEQYQQDNSHIETRQAIQPIITQNGFAHIAFKAGWKANNEHHKATIDKVVEVVEEMISSKIEFLKAQGLIQPEHHIGELTDLLTQIKEI